MPHGDVLYLVGLQDTDELKYSLRSLRFVDHDRVWIAGHLPDWVTGVQRIDVPQDRSKRENTLANLRAALAEPELSDPFQLWCDDFYAMQPIGRLPVMHVGPLIDTIHRARGGYRRALHQAATYLAQQGVGKPLAYDAIHVPQRFHKEPLTEVLDTGVVMYQTVYGNLHRDEPGELVVNAKQSNGYEARAWLSTNSAAWGGPMGRHIRATHPDLGPYEVADA